MTHLERMNLPFEMSYRNALKNKRLSVSTVIHWPFDKGLGSQIGALLLAKCCFCFFAMTKSGVGR